MAAPLNDMLNLQPNALIHTEKFRAVVEMHLQYFINAGMTISADIAPEKAYEFDGDFYGVCGTIKEAADPALHWVNLRLNGYTHPFQYTADKMKIIVVRQEAMRILEQRYKMIHQSS